MEGLGDGPTALAYSVDEAAAVISISPRQVWRHLSTGRLRAVKVDGRTLIRRGELIRFLRSSPAYEPAPATPPGAA